MDRFIFRGMALFILALITSTIGGAIFTAYHGVYELVTHHVAVGALQLGAAAALGLAGWLLIRNREDLLV